MVLGLTFKSLSILSLFLYVEWDSGQVSFFCMWLSSFPYTTRWRDCPFFTVCFLLLCHELIGHICMGLSQGSWFCSIGLCICSSANTMLFCQSGYLLLYLRFVLAICAPCCVNFRISLPSPKKSPFEILIWNCIDYIDQFGENWHLSNFILLIQECAMSLYFGL